MSQLLLQPCPFCGGEPKIMHCGAGTYMIQCLGCKATTDDGGETRVSANWNRRSPAVSPPQGLGDEGKLTPEAAWTYLCETPDITSPEEYPDHALITFEQLRSYMEGAMPVEANDSTKGAEASFTEYFIRNYPGPNTVIYDPKWHAPKIFRAAAYALSAQVRDVAEKGAGNPEETSLYRKVNAALDAAHKACFNHPDRGPIGMSHGAFSGVNFALGVVADLEKENEYLRAKLAAEPATKQEGGA
ncbi:Lar family restriction alleviation protein [Agrobacterium rosae]|uniref:Lar family restriction alleviation protein n=1 Tax=Agrobacterium rosae TaxID=1972867 RepID=A0AAW9FCZ2_9HYPH|nr:Lar family restriction alleviation protein [Agrobacterium rosae]MDX8301462.1 Lar family restriction alleviation protein [Agrobacterium rosae]